MLTIATTACTESNVALPNCISMRTLVAFRRYPEEGSCERSNPPRRIWQGYPSGYSVLMRALPMASTILKLAYHCGIFGQHYVLLSKYRITCKSITSDRVWSNQIEQRKGIIRFRTELSVGGASEYWRSNLLRKIARLNSGKMELHERKKAFNG
jgi:hypothetical protein